MDVNQILFNSGMVGAFIVFAIVMRRFEAAERKERDQQWRDFMTEQQSRLVGFLNLEREQRKEIMGTAYRDFSKNMDRLAEGMGSLTKAIGEHEIDAQLRTQKILDAVDTINGVN